ncbi:MAG: alpha/beta fold hydrolase [Betaproteobacteria bacterium]|nr:alpha/beta fold hydrolase [Betaproteobacteria bacterium]
MTSPGRNERIAQVHNQDVATKPFRTHLERAGAGNREAILFLHGSGPGASGWSNWLRALPALGTSFDCLAPDFVGFASSEHLDHPPTDPLAWVDIWVEQITSLLDVLDIERTNLVGNSMGGNIALHLAHRHPGRFKRIALMGSSGVPLKITPKLGALRGFFSEPSAERMSQIVSGFFYNPEAFSEEIRTVARLRLEAAKDPRVGRSYQAIFSGSPQKQLDARALPDEVLERIEHPCLLIHGRDDMIVPLGTSLYLLQKLPKVQLHVYGRAGHWTQLEYADSFHNLLRRFFIEDAD